MALQDKEFIRMNIANLQAFQATLKKASAKVSDLTIPMGEIARDFYKSERAIFQLSSAGGFPDFKQNDKGRSPYKESKLRKYGFAYPLLKASGKLEASITSPDAEGSHLVVGKNFVEIGSTIEYGIFHNSDLPRSKIPQRKFLFLGPESREFAGKSEFGGRPIRWKNIIEFYVKSVMGEL